MSFKTICAIVLILLGGSAVRAGELIPVEHFARNPAMNAVALSPNGQRLAYLMNEEGVTVLATYDLTKREQHYVARSDNTEHSIRWFSWANDDELLVSILYRSHAGGTKYYRTRLSVSDWQGKDMDILVKPRNNPVKASIGTHGRDDERSAQFQDRVIAEMPDDPEHILLAADFENPGRPGIYKINLDNKHRTKLMSPVASVNHWVGDKDGEWLAGAGGLESTMEVYVRKIDNKATQRKLWEYDVTKTDGPYPLGFNEDPKRLIISAPHNGRQAIYAVDFMEEDFSMELLAADEKYDIHGDLIRSPATGNYVGVYYEGSSGQHVYWDKDRQGLQTGLDKALPGINRIVSFSRDEKKYVVRHSQPDKPDIYLLGDRDDGTVEKIGSVFPELENAALPHRRPITVKTRDGLTLEGYLTLPADSEKPLPAVVLPHGGPSGRDTGQFDFRSAFIASRGYAVLQVNFRGSSGYGDAFAREQMQKWGLELQNDITDSTRWMIEQKIADPERICIAGHSYGGYAALMGAVKTPDLFQCAVGSAGVYNLIDFINHTWKFTSDEMIEHQFGSKWFDRDRLKATSPVYHAEEVEIPVLIFHGDEDRVVPVKQAHDMVDELEDADKNVKFILQEGGDHSFRHYNQRLEYLSELEAFLAKHLM